MDHLVSTMKINLLKYAAGHAMFCPGCDNILDARRTVLLEFSKDGQPAGTKTVCSRCYDERLKPGLADAFRDQPGFSFEVTDGREAFRRRASRRTGVTVP